MKSQGKENTTSLCGKTWKRQLGPTGSSHYENTTLDEQQTTVAFIALYLTKMWKVHQKVKAELLIVFSRTIFSGVIFKLSLFSWGYQSLMSLWRNSVPLFFVTLLHIIEAVGDSSMPSSLTVPPQDFSQVEVKTRTGTLQQLDTFLVQTCICRLL